MIKSIEIENYKNFKHLKMENFKLINFFTGQNDTGKTNLLEALYINTGLCDSAVQVSLPPEHVVLVSEFRKIKLNNDNLKTFFYQENTANPISIRTEFEHATIPLTIQYPTQTSYSKDINLNSDDIHMTNLISKTITKPQLQFFYNPSFSPMTMTYEFERQNLSLIHSDLDKIAQTYKENTMFIPVELSIVNSLQALENLRLASKEKELMEVLKYFNPDILDADTIRNSVYIQIKNENTSLKESPKRLLNSFGWGFIKFFIMEVLKYFNPDILDADTIRNSVYIQIKNENTPLKESPKRLLNSFGWGFIKFFIMASILIDNRVKYLFIDEIESGLHYTKMQEFLKALFELAQKLQIQIFATTHNKEFLLNAINTMPNNETGVFKDIALFEFEKESAFGFIRHSYSMLEKALYRGMEVRG
ncbi:ATP/GTP-binding protein [Helicobacter pylori]|nr:ATP/GTP-binding protein [Helicobacter pylori]